ncbi:hypothetical protein MYX06_03270 [Patescibacteria group bacterium AH-259-L05]|nr:hypothetical protein [Patescibacteria group bacterium AH-259-L05]
MSQRLTKIQRDVLVGTILGDACIESCKKEDRIQIAHSGKQKDYVFWKYQYLKDWTLSSPRFMSYKDNRNGKVYSRWRFRTISHPEFTHYKRIFYRKKIKIIPKDIKKILKSPLSLAVWYMDDGKKRPDCRAAYLDTICFSEKDQNILIECLKDSFGIDTRLHWNGDGHHIYIPFNAIDRFRKLIEKFIIPSMTYKLPYTRNDSLPPRQRIARNLKI